MTRAKIYVIITIQLSVVGVHRKERYTMDYKTNNTTLSSGKNYITKAADLFAQLSPDAQDKIIDLIKSLLSAKQ